MTTAAIYCRISKDRIGAGLGVDRQERECRDLAERLGWTVARVFTDNDLSAYSGKTRPGYEALCGAIEARRINAVIVWHTDRLHRSPTELERYITLCEPRGIPTSCVQAGDLDLATASGRMTARITGAVARHESEHMAERIRAKKAEQATAGKPLGGRRPFGFEPDQVSPRQPEFDALAAGIRSVLAGGSLSGLAHAWNAAGVRPPIAAKWSAVAVRSVIQKWRNAGLHEHRGQLRPAVWPAAVTEAELRALRTLLDDPSRRTANGTSLKWQGSSLYVCGRCGDGTSMRSASLSTNRGTVPMYRCRVYPHNSIKVEPVDEYVNRVIVEVLRKHGAGLLHGDTPGVNVDALTSERAALLERRDALAAQFATGALSDGEWTSARAAGQERLDAIQTVLDSVNPDSPLSGVADALDPGAAFLDAPVERRRAIVRALATVAILPATKVAGRRGEVDLGRIAIEPLVKR